MKKIMAGSGAYRCECYTDDCYVDMSIYYSGWNMLVYCTGDVEPSYFSGSGAYGGTACHGQCP